MVRTNARDIPPAANIKIKPGTTLYDFLHGQGYLVRLCHEPAPNPLLEVARRAQEVGKEVSSLLRKCERYEDVPPPRWNHGRGECVVCDARRIVAEMLD